MNREMKVSTGGLFNTRRIEYSPETQRFIKELIAESKMSMFQRKRINESIKRGDPLPLPSKPLERVKHTPPDTFGQVRKIQVPRRRRKEQIECMKINDKESGFVHKSPVDYSKEKQRLQDLMSFGKTIKIERGKAWNRSPSPLENNKDVEKQNRTEWVLKEIEEREQFLTDMKRVGLGKKYEGIIRQEIAAKLRDLENSETEFKNILKQDYKEKQDFKAHTAPLLS